MESIYTYLRQAVGENYSDLFVAAGKAISGKKGDKIVSVGQEPLTPEQASHLVQELYSFAKRPVDRYSTRGDDDFSVSVPGLARFRVSTYRQRGTMAAAIRVVHFGIPDWREMGIPEDIIRVADISSGLVLMTGPANAGKSTTLACIVDAINHRRSVHIVTVEDPIEYLHKDDKSYITQRELAVDTESYIAALRASLRQSSDVILLGELADEGTIQLAITAAESGRLVISTLNTMGAVNTVEHIIDLFRSERQQPLRIQLSKVLKAIVSQQLLPGENGGLIPAFEIMYVDNAIRGMIRDGRTEQINSVVRNFGISGTVSMDDFILRLFKAGQVSRETALQFAMNRDHLQKKL